MDSTRDRSPLTVQPSAQDERIPRISEHHLSLLPLIADAIDETVAENNARCKEIVQLLNQLNIDPKSMPNDIQDLWNEASMILRAEGLSEIDKIALTISMECKRIKSIKAAREERKLRTRYDDICDRLTNILKECNKAQESIGLLQKMIESRFVNEEDYYVNSIFMATKLHDYREAVNQLDGTLGEMEVSDCYPNKILDKHKTYLHLMEELHRVNESLMKYGKLPPVLPEARIIVEEQEKHLMELNNELSLRTN